MKYSFGCWKSKRDERDWLLRGFITKEITLPSDFDLTNKMTPVRSQGKEGACVGFAMVTGVKEYQETTGEDAQAKIKLSPRFLYEYAKKLSGHQEGTTLKAAMQVAFTLGVCDELYWPYNPGIVGFPSEGADENAKQYKIKTYARVNSIEELKRALIDPLIGPVLIGIKVFNGIVSKECQDTGIVPDPGCFERMRVLGGHALCVCGYEDKSLYYKNDGHIKVKNSWGPIYGDSGYLYLSYKYIESNMLDAFTSVDIENPTPVTIENLSHFERTNLIWV